MHISPRLLAAVPLLFAGPCFQLRIDTSVAVNEDGSARRTVEIRSTDTTKISVRRPNEPGGFGGLALAVLLDGSFTTLPVVSSGDKKPGAWSRTHRFERNEIARDVVLARRDTGPRASNAAVVHVDDYALFDRLRYRESIADGTDRAGMSEAARKIATLATEILVTAARDLLGAAYELADLEEWLRGEGHALLVRFVVDLVDAGEDHDAMLEACSAALRSASLATDDARLRRLVVPGVAKEPGDDAAFVRDFETAVHRRLTSLLRRPRTTRESPGAPVQEQELSFLRDHDLIQSTFQRAVLRITGSKDGLGDALEEAGSHLFGCFGSSFLDPSLGGDSVRWRTVLRMPGQILRTTGVPLRDGSILWLHLSKDLAHRTQLLEADSIVFDEGAVALLGGRLDGVGPEEILELLSILGSGRDRVPDPRLVGPLADAVRGDPTARQKVLKDGDYETVRQILRIGG